MLLSLLRCSCVAINGSIDYSLQDDGGFIPDIMLLTLSMLLKSSNAIGEPN